MELSKDQHEAVDSIVEHFLNGGTRFVLGGSAGTGKTFTMQRVIERLHEESPGRTVHITATTHKAARVLSETTGRGASTVHSLFGLKPTTTFDGLEKLIRGNDVRADFGSIVIVDEASMVNEELLHLIEEVANELHLLLLFVGDPYQLPPVNGTSIVFYSEFPRALLTTVHRQGLENPIIKCAQEWRKHIQNLVHANDTSEPSLSDYADAVNTKGEGIVMLPLAEFTDALEAAYRMDSLDTLTVAYTNRKVHDYIRQLRYVVYGDEALEQAILPGETLVSNTTITKFNPRMGQEEVVLANEDRVIARRAVETVDKHGVEGIKVQLVQNNLELFVATDYGEAQSVIKQFYKTAMDTQRAYKAGEASDSDRRARWREYFKVRSMYADLRAPLASTVHKAQGSTFRTVFIDSRDILRCGNELTRARLIYTGLTRGSHNVFILQP